MFLTCWKAFWFFSITTRWPSGCGTASVQSYREAWGGSNGSLSVLVLFLGKGLFFPYLTRSETSMKFQGMYRDLQWWDPYFHMLPILLGIHMGVVWEATMGPWESHHESQRKVEALHYFILFSLPCSWQVIHPMISHIPHDIPHDIHHHHHHHHHHHLYIYISIYISPWYAIHAHITMGHGVISIISDRVSPRGLRQAGPSVPRPAETRVDPEDGVARREPPRSMGYHGV